MAFEIALLARGVLVFGIVGHSSRTEAHNLLLTAQPLPVGSQGAPSRSALPALTILHKHRVKLLFSLTRLADRLELEHHSTPLW